jgi:hypothetical protein
LPVSVGAIAAVVSVAVLGVAWLVAGFFLMVEAGGTLGGYGDPARAPTASWYGPVMLLLGAVGLVAAVVVGLVVGYVRSRARTKVSR